MFQYIVNVFFFKEDFWGEFLGQARPKLNSDSVKGYGSTGIDKLKVKLFFQMLERLSWDNCVINLKEAWK